MFKIFFRGRLKGRNPKAEGRSPKSEGLAQAPGMDLPGSCKSLCCRCLYQFSLGWLALQQKGIEGLLNSYAPFPLTPAPLHRTLSDFPHFVLHFVPHLVEKCLSFGKTRDKVEDKVRDKVTHVIQSSGQWGRGEGEGDIRRSRVAPLLCLLLALGVAGCRTVPLPAVNLKEPGWTVHEGQAVWRLEHGTREIAGEVLVATQADGRALVQFTKAPFPLVIGQETPNRWQVEFPPQNRHYSGRGKPPKRLIWLYLPRVLAGQQPPANWRWHEDNSGWRLENRASGEALEGYFTQGN